MAEDKWQLSRFKIMIFNLKIKYILTKFYKFINYENEIYLDERDKKISF